MQYNYNSIKDLINSSKGKYCSVRFIKKDGSVRNMAVQPAKLKFEVKGDDASESGRKAAETRAARHPNLMPVWSVDAGAIRSVNLETVQEIKIAGKKYSFN